MADNYDLKKKKSYNPSPTLLSLHNFSCSFSLLSFTFYLTAWPHRVLHLKCGRLRWYFPALLPLTPLIIKPKSHRATLKRPRRGWEGGGHVVGESAEEREERIKAPPSLIHLPSPHYPPDSTKRTFHPKNSGPVITSYAHWMGRF